MADIVMPHSVPCQFEESWVGTCKKPSTNGWCSKHEALKCCSCGKKAVRDCEHTSSLVCGAPLCATCHHSLTGDEHITKEVYDHQVVARRKEKEAKETSRTSRVQRLNTNGLPANAFELVKGDWKVAGYKLEQCYFLQLTHGLMAFFPAIVESDKHIVITIDRSLLAEVWKLLEPRGSKIGSVICYVNAEKGIAYPFVKDQDEQEKAVPEKLLDRRGFDKLIAEFEEPFRWAPGLIGGRYIDKEEFLEFITRAEQCAA